MRRKKRRYGNASESTRRSTQSQDSETLALEIVDDLGPTQHPKLQEHQTAPEPANPGDAVGSPADSAAAPETPKLGDGDAQAAVQTLVVQHQDEVAAGSTVSAAEPLAAEESTQRAQDDPNEIVETLGELLQQARETKGLSLEETSARTRIAVKMLRHLENDRFGELPAEAYVKGFLRNYGSFLGLDVGMLLRRYEALIGREVDTGTEIWVEDDEQRSWLRDWKPRRGVTILILVLLVFALAWVFWSRGASKLGLRPTGGLEQIEKELRDVQSAKPSAVTDQSSLEQAAGLNVGDAAAANSESAQQEPGQESALPEITDMVETPPVNSAPVREQSAPPPVNTKPTSVPSKPPAARPVQPSTQPPPQSTVQPSAATTPPKPTLPPTPKPKPKPKKPKPKPPKAEPRTSPEDAAGPP